MFEQVNGELYVYSVSVCFDISRHISYRFRLVSISCDPSFTFSIDSHQMTIIEVEGTNVQPLVVDSLPIFAGTCESYILSCLGCTNRFRNRSTLLRCRKIIYFISIQEGRPHLRFRSLRTNRLITTVCAIDVVLREVFIV
jgi:hypothetical protein